MLQRLGRTAARRHRWFLAAWLVLLVGAGGAATVWGGTPHDEFAIPGTDSQAAAEVLARSFPSEQDPTALLVFEAPAGSSVDDPAAQGAVETVLAAVRRLDHVASVSDPYETAAQFAQATAALGIDAGGAAGVSRDGRVATATVAYDVRSPNPRSVLGPDAFDDLDAALAPARQAGLGTAIGGTIADVYDTGDSGLSAHADDVGLLVALVILVVAFGSLVAAGMPIGVALVGLGTGLSLVTVLERFTVIGTVAPILATMIGLGVGIDYSLFVVTRYRQNLAAGMEPVEAVGVAVGTAGAAVLFAGCTVCLATLGLVLAGIPYVTTLGWVSAVVVAVMVLAALTLLPALLGLAGRRIDALRVPGLGRGSADGSPMWARWARTVGRRPLVSAGLAVVVLGVLALPFAHMRVGFPDDSSAPPGSQQREAFDDVTAAFGPGANGPLLVTVTIDAAAARDQATVLADVVALTKAIDATRGVAQVSPPVPNAAGDAAVIAVTPAGAPDSEETVDLVRRLRADVVPAAVRGSAISPSDVHVGGLTAVLIDLGDRISDRLPIFIGVVVLGSFLLLMAVFRSVLVPLQAAVANILSIGAAYGAVVWVFQDGVGRSLIGLPETVPVVAFVPLMMFAILFGLSMDYEVFLMSRIREEWLRTHDHREAIARGIALTARVITSAALIMIAVFLAFVTNPQPAVKMMGFGLAVAVLVDATVVRLLFVPATLELMGPAAWWFPRWLDRLLPRLDLEGGDAPEAAGAGEVPPPLQPELVEPAGAAPR